jgi:hypothetical protein
MRDDLIWQYIFVCVIGYRTAAERKSARREEKHKRFSSRANMERPTTTTTNGEWRRRRVKKFYRVLKRMHKGEEGRKR